MPARVAGLFARLTLPERALFVGALTGSLRQGSLGGIMLLALVDLSGLDPEAVRRAVLVTGSIPRAAEALLGPGAGDAPPHALVLFRPVAPMLASSAPSLEDLFADGAPRLIEWKVDGLRAQIHKKAGRVAVFSRQGNDMTAGCAPVLDALASMPVDSAIVDGEVVLVGPTGVARPFQETFSAIASKRSLRGDESLRVYLFDCVHADGRDLLDEPLTVRREALAGFAPVALRMPAAIARTADEATAFQRAALAAGHEGVMVKDLASTYRFGARGRAWQKVKEFTTVDLVVLAVERGSGRRKGLLSNLHLGARRDDGTFCMVGKTFKGLTDELLRWQTERLQALAEGDGGTRRARATGAGRRDSLQRGAAKPSLPRRHRASLRARRPLPGGQVRERDRHARVARRTGAREDRAGPATARPGAAAHEGEHPAAHALREVTGRRG